MSERAGDAFVGAIVDGVAERVLELLRGQQDDAGAGSPWMTVEEAAEYSRIPLGTFRRLAASGAIPSHSSGKRHLFHRAEVDEALLGYARGTNVTPLRKAS